MILYVFLILFGAFLAFATFSYTADMQFLAIVAYTLLFFAATGWLFTGLEIPTGETRAYTYTNTSTNQIQTISITPTYTEYTNSTAAFLLLVSAVFAFIVELMNLRGFTDQEIIDYARYRFK